MPIRFLSFFTTLLFLVNVPTARAAESVPPASQLNLSDLGFSEKDMMADHAQQDLLNERSSMLHTHQILALTTLALMTGAFLTSPNHAPPSVIHQAFGYTSVATYAAAAYFAIAAPEQEGFSEAGWNMKLHRSLVFIHFPGMILTPIAGYLAAKARRAGREPTGIAKYKGAIATTTYFAMATAALSVTINF
ncbi:MAG: hypothetical protein ABIR96_07670 [Bdellovibrionota bacterium]